MKKLKSILILTFCFALLLTTTTIPEDNIIAPTSHLEKNTGEQ